MQINRNNYESILMDYLEGNLSDEARAAVEAFLLINADIQSEFEEMSGAQLARVEIEFDAKATLKMDDELSPLTLLMLQDMDGTLSPDKIEVLQSALKDPRNAEEYRLLQAMTVRPQASSDTRFIDLLWPDTLDQEQESKLKELELNLGLMASAIEFPYKALLRIETRVDLQRLDYLAIASAEGDAQPNERTLKNHPDLQAKIQAYSQLKLRAGDEIFENKSDLKKRETIVLFFTPVVKRAVAIAAVFLVCFGVWQSWQRPGIEQPGLANQSVDREKPNTEVGQGQGARAEVEQTNVDSLTLPGKTERPLKRVVQVEAQENEMAHIEEPNDRPVDAIEQEKEIQELPNVITELAEQKPESPLSTPYSPIPKESTIAHRSQEEPITLLAFIGDKLENRIEQSPVYAFIDRKKREIFESHDQKEPLRYERVASKDGVRQKLVLWGVELQRTKHKK